MAAALPPGPCTASLRCRCDAYGLPTAIALCEVLGVSERSVDRWWRTDHPVPPGVVAELEDLFAYTEQVLIATIDAHRQADVVLTYRTTSEMHALRADLADRGLPASWHRVLTDRVRQALPHLDVQYA